MTRTIRTLAVPVLAALLLAGCGSTDDEATPASSQAQQSDVGDASDQGGVVAAAASDGGVATEVDESGVPSFPLADIFATSESGTTFTLGQPEALAKDDADLLLAAGWEQGKVDATKVIPVEIDNTYGTSETSVDGLTTVSPDGNELQYQTLASFFPTVADDEGVIDHDSDLYYKMWDAHPWDDEKVAPTAKSKAYIVVPHNWDVSGGFTYVGITVDMLDELPMYPENFGVDDPNGPHDDE